jgi:hypothetical protein
VAKGGAVRRHLRIPNPIHYLGLAEHVVEHWEPLRAACDSSPYSLTKTILDGDRALNVANTLRDRVEHRARVRADGRYLVRADITRFYSSIYTHSLPWAVLGKAEAKARFQAGTLAGHWSDALDRRVRKLNGEQTAGIPIGPDISLLIAEALLANVDNQVHRRHPTIEGIRYIDDYEFTTHTRDEADAVLSTLQGALRELELELNTSKTAICELPVPLTEDWVAELRRHRIEPRRPAAQREDLTEYFGAVFRTMRNNPEEQVLKYALGRLKHLVVHPDNWKLFEFLVQQCVGADPSCLPLIGAEVEYYRFFDRELNPKWREILNKIIVRQLPFGNASEAAWAMSLLLQFKLSMPPDVAKVVATTDDSVAASMAMLLAQSDLAPWGELDGLRRFLEPEYLNKSQWLVCYEASVWHWLGMTPAMLSSQPWFAYLAQGPQEQIVTFLNPHATLARTEKRDPDDDDDEDDDEDESY